MDERRRRPPDLVLRWVEGHLGPGARVVGWRRLTGGITASMHRLSVRTPTGSVGVVLRRWVPGPLASQTWALGAVAREAFVLEALEATDIPAPRLIAASTGAETDGVPAVAMTSVAGKLDLAPKDPARWIAQLARVLAQIHAASIDAERWTPWRTADDIADATWSSAPEVWAAARDAIRSLDDSSAVTFIHGDFQHFNVLWSRGRLTAVVDWPNAATGPPDLDVGHCRLNLAILFSATRAEEFLRTYEREAGRTVDARWDLFALLSYDQRWKHFIPVQVHGRAPVDAAGMDARVEATIAAALTRL